MTRPHLHVALCQATFDNVQEALVLLDRSGKIIFYNRAADELARQMLDAEFDVGQHLAELYAEHLSARYYDRIDEYVERAKRGEAVVIRDEVPAADRPPFTREYRYAPVRDEAGEVIAVSVTSRDLHEVRAVEQKLEESETRFWQFFGKLPVAAGILGKGGEWLQANPAYEQLLGYSPDELVGVSPAELTHEEDAETTEQIIADLLAERIPLAKLEQRIRHKDGHYLWCDITAVAFRPSKDGPARILGILSDVTHRKQLEDQLQETEKMRIIGQLAGGVAHDFNNLLTIITSYTHYALSELGPTSALAHALDKVLQAAHRGSSLTDQLLAFSRRQLSRPKTLDLNCVIEDTREMLDRLLRPMVELSVDCERDVTPIFIDRGQLEQVLFNLVMNARDAMPEGGKLLIQTSVRTLDRPRQTRLERIPQGAYGVLEVCDTGTGIDPDIIEHIFEPFFTTKEVGAGTGLGLASTWGVVKQAGGFIDVDSTLGEGTTFRLYFPLSDERPDQQASPHAADSRRASNATVLLVEDDVEVREALRRFLDRRGFRVLEAANGAEALECARGYTDIIDVLLTDVVMPGMSGKEVATTLCRERPEMHVFLMTGYAGERLGAQKERWEILPKPLDLDVLSNKLEDVLG